MLSLPSKSTVRTTWPLNVPMAAGLNLTSMLALPPTGIVTGVEPTTTWKERSPVATASRSVITAFPVLRITSGLVTSPQPPTVPNATLARSTLSVSPVIGLIALPASSPPGTSHVELSAVTTSIPLEVPTAFGAKITGICRMSPGSSIHGIATVGIVNAGSIEKFALPATLRSVTVVRRVGRAVSVTVCVSLRRVVCRLTVGNAGTGLNCRWDSIPTPRIWRVMLPWAPDSRST